MNLDTVRNGEEFLKNNHGENHRWKYEFEDVSL